MPIPLTFPRAIDSFISDAASQGRLRSEASQRSYRATLYKHADDSEHGPTVSTREDAKRTLRRWPNPNTQHVNRSILVAFYRWTMEEGLRPDNPALQTARPKRREPNVYRLTLLESQKMLAATIDTRERWAITLGLCAGLRNAELRGLQGRHFSRPGFVWVSGDIGKGGRERWVPLIADLAPVVREVASRVEPDAYVLPAQRWRDPTVNRDRKDLPRQVCSSQALRALVMRVAKRAGIVAHVHPHVLRHAFADHISQEGGERVAQQMLGHASLATTEAYLRKAPQLDRLSAAVAEISYGSVTTGLLPKALPDGFRPTAS